MPSTVNVLAVWVSVCAIAAVAPAPAVAGEGGWVPSLAVTGGAMIQKQTSSVESFCADGGPGGDDQAERLEDLKDLGLVSCDFNFESLQEVEDDPLANWIGGTAPLRPADSGDERAVSPFFGFDLQLMAPSIPRIPGRPRLFVRGEVQFMFGSARNTASEGDPSGISFPPKKGNPETPTAALGGLGSKTTSEIQTLGWGAGVGIAFPFRVRGRQLWVKPGAAWTRYGIDVEGIVLTGIKNDPPFSTGAYGDVLRTIRLTGEGSKTFDGIGPSLEIEMDVGHFGPIGASLFIGAGAYRILGDRSIRFSDSFYHELETAAGQRDLPADTYTANWSYEVDPWLYRGRVGLRFSWLGK